MTPSATISLVRTTTGLDSTNYPDSIAIQHYNFIYQDLTSNIITQIDEDYFFEIGKADTVNGQEEYVIKEVLRNGANRKINEINNVYIKYATTDEYYTKARRINPTQLEYDTDWYKNSWSKFDPFFFIQDQSVFIFPAPDADVTDGIKIHCIYQPGDLTTSSTEADVELQPRFHQNIYKGMLWLAYGYKKQRQEEQLAEAEYERRKKEMISTMKNRNQTTIQILPGNY